MKKVLLFAALTALPALSFAQVSFGVKGGVNLSQLSFGDFVTTRLNANGSPVVSVNGQTFRDSLRQSFDTRTGTSFGVYARIGGNLFVQPEVLYSTKAGSFNIVRTGSDGRPVTETISSKVTSFDVPILLGIKGGPIRVVAGPVISFRVNNDQGFSNAFRQYTTGTLNDAWAKAYYGYQIGVGLDLGSFGLDVRREGSISDIAAIDLGTAGNAQAFNQKLKSWQITLALKLF